MAKAAFIGLGVMGFPMAGHKVTALVDQFYGDVQQMGGRCWDTSSLIARLEVKKARGPGGDR